MRAVARSCVPMKGGVSAEAPVANAPDCHEGGLLWWNAPAVTEERAQRRPVFNVAWRVGSQPRKVDVCLLSDQGEHLGQLAVPPDVDALKGFARRIEETYREPVCAVIESMTGARFVHDTLEQAGWEVTERLCRRSGLTIRRTRRWPARARIWCARRGRHWAPSRSARAQGVGRALARSRLTEPARILARCSVRSARRSIGGWKT